ncbi:MAG TPA: hypothetical protein DCE41_11325, partial [Cytophagales bacterium]|nr:hypothetical protein [Cytophagales bacterium]
QSTDNFRFPGGNEAPHSAINQTQVTTGLGKELVDGSTLSWRNQGSRGLFRRPLGFQNNPNERRTLHNRYTYQTDLTWRTLRQGLQPVEQQLWGL